MSKKNKNPYLSGQQPKNDMDYRMIMEEQREKREREELRPGKPEMKVDRSALGLPENSSSGRRNSQFDFDVNRDLKQNVDFADLGRGGDKYSANYRPVQRYEGSRHMYEALAQTGEVTPEDVRELYGPDASRRSPERKAPVRHPERSVEERRAELESMLPDQGKFTLEQVMKEREKKSQIMPSLIQEDMQPEQEEYIPEIEEVPIDTPLKESIDKPGFEYRKRYLHSGLQEDSRNELPQREGFGGAGGRMPEFESETQNWSDRSAEELFAPMTPREPVIFPMEDQEEKIYGGPKSRAGSVKKKSISREYAEQPREKTKQEQMAEIHAARRRSREKKRTAMRNNMQPVVPSPEEANSAYETGLSNAAYLAAQQAEAERLAVEELERKHAQIARAMDIMEELDNNFPNPKEENQQEAVPIEQSQEYAGFDSIEEQENQQRSFVVPVEEMQEQKAPAKIDRKKSAYSYLFDDSEPMPDTFSDYATISRSAEVSATAENSSPYGYLYMDEEEINRQTGISEEVLEAEDEPAHAFVPLPPEPRPPAPPAAAPRMQEKKQNRAVKSGKKLDFELTFDQQMQSKPKLRRADFTEVIENEDEEYELSDDDRKNTGGTSSNIGEEPSGEELGEKEPVAPESIAGEENLWEEIAKERHLGGSSEIKEKIKSFSRDMVKKGTSAAAGIKEKFAARAETEPSVSSSDEEYTDASQTEEIRGELFEKLSELIFRITATGAFFVILLAVEFLPIFGVKIPLFSPENPVIYYSFSLALTVFIAVANYKVIYNSIKSIVGRRIDGGFGVLCATAAVIVQDICLLFSNGANVRSYSVILALVFAVHDIGEFINLVRIGRNFTFVSHKGGKRGAILLAAGSDENSVRIGTDTGEESAVAYPVKTEFLSDFLTFSYEEDPSEVSSSRILPYLTGASVLVGIVAGIISASFLTGICAFTASCLISIPVTRMLCVNLPLLSVSKKLLKQGAMLSGWPAVDEFGDATVLAVDENLLFPASKIELCGIKVFGSQHIDEAITEAAAIAIAGGGSLAKVFGAIIRDKTELLPQVEQVEYLQGKGFCGWVGGHRMLIGNLTLMDEFQVDKPKRDYEKVYEKEKSRLLYLASGGELCAMFVLKYHTDEKTAAAVQRLEKKRIHFCVRSLDVNIDKKMVSSKFEIPEESISILSGESVQAYEGLTGTIRKKAPAVLATNRNLSAIANGLSAAIAMKSSLAIAVILQTIGAVLGLILAAVLSCAGVVTIITPVQMFFYQVFWMLAVLLIPRIGKKG